MKFNNCHHTIKGDEMIMCHPGAYEIQLAKPPNESLKCTIKQGSYEETTPEIAKITGKKNYDVELSLWGGAMTRLYIAKLAIIRLLDGKAQEGNSGFAKVTL